MGHMPTPPENDLGPVTWGRMPLPNSDGILIRNISMPHHVGPWLPNELLEEARSLGAQAGDTVRGTYRRQGGTVTFDRSSVVVERDGQIVARAAEQAGLSAHHYHRGFGMRAGDGPWMSFPDEMVDE